MRWTRPSLSSSHRSIKLIRCGIIRARLVTTLNAFKRPDGRPRSAAAQRTLPPFRLVLVGQPNVGKSTLFNRLVGRAAAIVNAEPGTTRDCRTEEAQLFDLRFTLVDTGGVDPMAGGLSTEERDALQRSEAGTDSGDGGGVNVAYQGMSGVLSRLITRQSELALADADAVLMMVDGREGVNTVDTELSRWVRRRVEPETPVYLGVNKCEGIDEESDAWMDIQSQCYALGLGDPLALSAAHGEGLQTLFHLLAPSVDALQAQHDEVAAQYAQSLALTTSRGGGGGEEGGAAIETPTDEALNLAIIGRPNVGKSTLINSLLDEERVLVAPMPGVTRDAVTTEWTYDGRPVRLVDTAGVRRKGRMDHSTVLEHESSLQTAESLKFAHVVVLVVDAMLGHVPRQDLTLAAEALEQGRGLIVVINKCDLLEKKLEAITGITQTMAELLPQGGNIPSVAISAKDGDGVSSVMPTALRSFDSWRTRVSTNHLNGFFRALLQQHPPPRELKPKFITQSRTRPPTFTVFGKRGGGEVSESFSRFVAEAIRSEFDLHGTPVRVFFRVRTQEGRAHAKRFTPGAQKKKARALRKRNKRC